MKIEISCVILCFNSARSIDRCLQSLRDSFASLSIPYEIWVVDNGSNDNSVTIVKRHRLEDTQIRLIQLDSNQGTTRPRNLALKQCTGKTILVLDSDAYMNADAIKCMQEDLKQCPGVGIVAPRLIFPDGRSQMSTDQFPTLPRKIQRVFMLRHLERHVTEQRAGPVDYAISAAWLMRSEVVAEVGMLDEKIFYAPEDADYCLRSWQSGYEVRFQPAATVVHDAQEKSRSLLPNYFTLVHMKGLAYYFLKHRYCLSVQRLRRRIGMGACHASVPG